MAPPTSFGAWLERRRKSLDLTRDRLGRRVGCSVSALRKIEGDERRPSRQLAELLAANLDIPAESRQTFVRVARGELTVDRLGPASLAASANQTADYDASRTFSNLPVPATSLVGRERELAATCRLLGDPECRLLTLIGPGGVGKTRLAIAVASACSPLFADGVYFVPLASLSSPAYIETAIASALGLSLSGAATPRAQLLRFVQTKALLLVLDNLEHLLDGAGLLAEILEHASRVKLLVTSRERANLYGEWAVEVEGLPISSERWSDIVQDSSAVALFAQRARQAQADFEMSAEERPWIHRICQLVEGMPLGIELAAAWVRVLPCSDIARKIERNLDFLATTVRDAPERHRSMQAVFDHSWRLLSDEERRVLHRLSVFRGGFRREEAEPVAGASLAVLASLSDKSLLHHSEHGRYDLHEFVRQYAGDYLAMSGDEMETRRRHARAYLALAEQAEPALLWRKTVEQPWRLRLEHETHNVRAALEFCQSDAAQTEEALRLVAALGRFWYLDGRWDEGRRWLSSRRRRINGSAPARCPLWA
jgi:predicted ATPase/transcriptional regulator with XRE-family HTH domain